MQKDDLQNILALASNLYERKADDIKLLNVRHLTVLTDYLLICTGSNEPHTKALAEFIDGKAAEMGYELRRKEGAAEGRWIVLDYGFFIIHIFHPQDREYYRLDKLWEDGDNSPELPFSQEQ
ncbi:MAG: ribosome silencing factor [Eubacteriales bacterium]|nr:ribosome silencing factor [Eubacteriales bacterium]